MHSTQLSTSGVFPAVVWDPIGNRWFSVWQDGSNLVFSDGRTTAINGNETSFPRLLFNEKIYLTYRDGASPYTGHLSIVGSNITLVKNLGPVHGMFPTVMGHDWFAYQRDGASASWPVVRELLTGGQKADVRFGAPTGLANIDQSGNVVTWDEISQLEHALFVSYAGYLRCVATDRGGKPCVVVDDHMGKQLVLWVGEDSQNPIIAWNGGHEYAVVAWSGAGQGVRLMTFNISELAEPTNIIPSEPTVQRCAKFFGWWFEDGRYGDSNAPSNVSFIGRGLFKDGSGNLPADANERILRSIDEDGGGFISAGDVRVVKPVWDKIFGVFVHEVGAPPDVRWAAVDARAEMSREGVKPRPVVAVINEWDALNSLFAGSADIIAPEIYFAEPYDSYEQMLAVATTRIQSVLTALYPTPIILVSQAYDRSDPRWLGREDQLKAIAQACFNALTNSRVLGIWPFAFNRPGGMTTYTDALRWYTAQESTMVRPPYPVNSGGGTGMDAKEVINRVKTITIPPDISDGAANWFIDNACWTRDRIKEPNGTPTMSRGAWTIYFNPVYYREMESRIAEFGQPTGTGAEVYARWGDWSFQSVTAAKNAYRAAQPPGDGDPR